MEHLKLPAAELKPSSSLPKKCNVFVYRLAASKNSAAATWIATYKLKKGKKLNVSLAKKKLAKGNRYLVVVRKGSSLVTTSMGIVR